MHLEHNPGENKKDLKRRINVALKDYKNGVRCTCGDEIWVIGSASVGNSCFTCITGESHPEDDYEIDSVMKMRNGFKGRRHINEIPPSKIGGFFDDDGYEINTDLMIKPPLCITCINNDDPNEELLCNMTRYDQKDEREFQCFAYKKRKI